MRLFTALWPTPEVTGALTAVLPELHPAWRATPPERWHVTLAFHGEDDPAVRARDLDRLAGAPAPRLRVAGTGTFPGVLWAGVDPAGPDDDAALRALVAGAGGDPDRFVAHLTLGRSRRRRPVRPGPVPHVPAGPWWTPREVLLVASTSGAGGPRYDEVHRVPLSVPVP